MLLRGNPAPFVSIVLLASTVVAASPPEVAPAAETPGAERAQGMTQVLANRHLYTLTECLMLAERNHPVLAMARARLANVHAQLDEARWIPYFQWSSTLSGGVMPAVGGTIFFGGTPFQDLNANLTNGLQPFFRYDLSGGVPIYTFGKITSGLKAAEAQTRAGEWDLEKNRLQVRTDVRRAYYGLMLTRDARYVVNEVTGRIETSLREVRAHIAKSDAGFDELDRLRLENYKDEIQLRSSDLDKGERFALASLRFLTGVQDVFDIIDKPLERPTRTLGPLLQYLTAARLYRPDVNLARSGVVARRALVDLQRARLFPDFALAMSASYAVSPSAVQQPVAWGNDPFNRFGYGFGFFVRWSMDLLPAQARVRRAEAELAEALAQERLALGGIAVEVENQYGIVFDAATREENWSRVEHRARGWMALVRDGIDLGTRDEKQMVEPLRNYVNARAQRMTALMDLRVHMSELARMTGWDEVASDE